MEKFANAKETKLKILQVNLYVEIAIKNVKLVMVF